jgi:hypothetical protein
VVEQPIEDRGRHHRIAEHLAPFADRTIGSDQHAAALVAARDELEEEMRRVGLERQVAELVDDQQLGLGVEAELFLEPALGVRLGQGREKGRRGDEQDRIAFADRRSAERDGQTGLADAGRGSDMLPGIRRLRGESSIRFTRGTVSGF